ncbi:unnamed protein product [Cylicocyclus nassatus]|uniref:Uncharacterized protein n=1 Tax=Cylicocyclus nassatus TaxID=53992 RepID=A0AA36GNF6_CYLNA|nr:unnamed protein product [Cylicocyclus nassatus]
MAMTSALPLNDENTHCACCYCSGFHGQLSESGRMNGQLHGFAHYIAKGLRTAVMESALNVERVTYVDAWLVPNE